MKLALSAQNTSMWCGGGTIAAVVEVLAAVIAAKKVAKVMLHAINASSGKRKGEA